MKAFAAGLLCALRWGLPLASHNNSDVGISQGKRMDEQALAVSPDSDAAMKVHPHPIRWDVEQQLWVCSRGLCDFSRPKREKEIVPTREEAQSEAMRAGTGADFAGIRPREAGASSLPEHSEPAPITVSSN